MLIGEKHVGPVVHTLKSTLQAAGTGCQRSKIGIIGDRHEKIDVLGTRLSRDDGTDQSDSPNAGDALNSTDKSEDARQHLFANGGFS